MKYFIKIKRAAIKPGIIAFAAHLLLSLTIPKYKSFS
jgi:hypothetical protein